MRARPWAIAAVFVANGLGGPSFLPRLPERQAALGLSDVGLGLVLTGMAVGALVASPAAGRAVGRVGSRPVAVAAGVAVAASLWTAGAAPHPIVLFLALAGIGAADAAMDIAMNANGAAYERLSGRSLLHRLHGAWSLGSLAAASVAALLAAAGVSVTWQLLGVGVVIAVTVLTAGSHLVADDHLDGGTARPRLPRTAPPRARPSRAPPRAARPPARRRARWVARPLAALAAVTLAGAVIEGGPSDWSAVRLERLGSGPGAAALGFAAFTAGMLAGRLIGDRLTDRHGGAAVLRGGMTLVAAGLVAGAVVDHPAVFAGGLVVAGLGAAGLFPLVFSAAATTPGVAPGAGAAVVSLAARLGFLVEPLLMGALAQTVGLRWAFVVVAAVAVAVAAAAPLVLGRRARARPGRRGRDRRPADRADQGRAVPERRGTPEGTVRDGPRPVAYDRPLVGAAPAIVARPDTAEVETAPSSRRDLVTPAAIALTLVPFVVLAVHMLRTDVFLSADLATTEMLTRDVGSHSPSLGPFSRDGWFHPGPALFYVLAPSYRLFGGDGSALAVGAVVVNALSVAAVGLLARRRGGTGLMLAALLGVAVLMHALGPTFLATPWNVYVTVLPYAALVFTIWAVVAGERWALPAATLLTSFLMQTHVGYVALAVPLLAAGAAWAVGAAVVDRRRRARDPDTQPGAAVVAPTTSPATRPARPTPSLPTPSPATPSVATPSPTPDAAERGAGSSGGLLGPLVVSAAIACPDVAAARRAAGDPRPGQRRSHRRVVPRGRRRGPHPPRGVAGRRRPVHLATRVDRRPGTARLRQRAGGRLPTGSSRSCSCPCWPPRATCGGAEGDRRAPWSRRGSWPPRWRSSPRRGRSGPSTPTACTGCGPSGWSGASSSAGRRGRWPPGARAPAPARCRSRWRSPPWPR